MHLKKIIKQLKKTDAKSLPIRREFALGILVDSLKLGEIKENLF